MHTPSRLLAPPLALALVACADKAGDTGAADACGGPGIICTYAGTGIAGLGDEDVPATDSHLYLPQDLTFGPDHQPYLLDWNNHRVRTVDADGHIHTVAGSGLLGDGPEGPALQAAFNHPTNIAFDGAGRMVIAAWHNSRIEAVDLSSGTLTFLCGTGERGYNGDGIPAESAVLDLPSSVAIDSRGRVWISDQANQQIRMVDGDTIHDMAGSQRVPGYRGDGGPAEDALFHASVGQAADPANRLTIAGSTLYVADTGNHLVRSIDLDTLQVDRLAGTAPTCDEAGTSCTYAPGHAGDGGPALDAQLSSPTDVAVGPDGEVYIADTGNSCVRVVHPDGTIDTFAGTCGEPGYAGDGGDPTGALLNRPYGVALDRHGNVYISDTYNHVVRVVER